MYIPRKVYKTERVTIKELTSGSRRKNVTGIRAQNAIGPVKKFEVALLRL
jgi:hypothetical protein